LSSDESPDESQRAGVLSLRCWSEHPGLRSDQEILPVSHVRRRTYRAVAAVIPTPDQKLADSGHQKFQVGGHWFQVGWPLLLQAYGQLGTRGHQCRHSGLRSCGSVL
jgi:hypothetical protein